MVDGGKEVLGSLCVCADLRGLRPAPGASSRTAALSPAWRAWCSMRASGVSGRARATASARALSSLRRAAGRASSIARRASSCRKAWPSSAGWRIPAAMHSLTAVSVASPHNARTAPVSARPGKTETASSTVRAASDRRSARASTASCTLAGGGCSRPPRSSSVTKNGLPDVARKTARPSIPDRRAMSATAPSERGGRSTRTTLSGGTSASARRRWLRPAASSRAVSSRRSRAFRIRRPRKRTKSRVASSAQCRSSITSRVAQSARLKISSAWRKPKAGVRGAQ